MTPSQGPLQTALHHTHLELGARMVPFAGYAMPVQYKTGVLEEHKAVRSHCGIFDVSHMGLAFCRGPHAKDFLNWALTRDLTKLEPGKAAYSLLCREDGNTVDDLIVYQKSTNLIYLVLNASNKDKDMAWLRELATRRPEFQIELTGPSSDHSLLAVQGPKAPEILKKLGASAVTDSNYHWPKTFTFHEWQLGGIPVEAAITGYTGELGCELMVHNKDAAKLWATLQQAGAIPCGLGARDTLRTEMGYSLYGHELSETINPVEAGLSWAIGFSKPDFMGKSALTSAKQNPKRKLVCLQNPGRQAPRAEMKVRDKSSGKEVGMICSGTYAPSLDRVIGMALVQANSMGPYEVDIRGTWVGFESTQRPFYQATKG